MPLGTTRSVVARDHALIAPDSHVPIVLPRWENARIVTVISPQMGARFQQYLALLEPGGRAVFADRQAVESFFYVLEGEVSVKPAADSPQGLKPGGYAFLPAGQSFLLQSPGAARLVVFERVYVPSAGHHSPACIIGREQDVEGKPFLGDPDALLQTLLPESPAFDMAVNIFTYQPGAALPFVEVHVMEHGLLMLEGAGVYRLSDSWYPVAAGDSIWMAPYCPQWFVAMGKSPARYLYYKDVNRDPLGES